MTHQYLMFDFETRSPIDLTTVSTTRYAQHPGTDILCIGMKFDGRPATVLVPPKGKFVLDGTIRPIELMHAIGHKIPIIVHNANFERRIYKAICVDRWGWPEIPDEQWVDTSPICSYYTLPRKLVEAAQAIGLNAQKDMEGHRLMLQISKPRKPRKKELADWVAQHGPNKPMPPLFWEDEEKLNRVAEYCKQDVVTQEELFRKLGRLPSQREAEWRFDMRVNDRGLMVDFGGLMAASDVIESSMGEYNAQLARVTATHAYPDGMVTRVTQRTKIKDFCELMGYTLISTKKEAVETALKSELPTKVREVLMILQESGKTSLGKVETMLDLTDDDGRVRDSTIWHGAATGRKAGQGIQPHNFPRDVMKDEEVETFHAALARPDAYQILTDRYRGKESIPDVVSSALRSFIVAPPGKKLFVSDFSNIETRILAWVGDCSLLSEAFRTGKCPYRQFASRVYNVPADSIAKGSQERQLGKVAVLGLGYGMGADKFQATALAPPYNIELDILRSKEIVKLYRDTYFEVPKFWSACEKAFITAIQNCTTVQVGRLAFGCNGEWGWIVLPSGRPIWMFRPTVTRVPSRWRENSTTLEIGYWGILQKNKKWGKRTTYGGSLVESICQATAGDLLQEALARIDLHGYAPILSVHDEVVAEAEENRSVDQFHELVKVRPAWALDLPIECESHASLRYGK